MQNWFSYFFLNPVEALDHPELAFGMFTPTHLITLGVMAILVAALVVVYCKLNTDRRRIMRLVMGIFVLLLELVLRQGAFIVLGIYTPSILPLHACAITTFAVFIDSVKPNSWCREWIYAIGTWGPLAAILTPDWIHQPIVNIFTWQAFLVHSCLIAYALMILISKEFRPSLKNLWKVLIILGIFVGASLIVNNTMGTNFWFLSTAVPGSPLEPIQNLTGSLYIPVLALILTVLWAAMYLPWRRRVTSEDQTTSVE